MYIEAVQADERDHLLEIAVQTGLFTPGDAEGLLGGVLTGLAGGLLPEGHAAVTCRRAPDAPAAGWSYFAPDPYADRVWNLWWIGVLPHEQGGGVAAALLSHVERVAAAHGARLLIIETSDLEPMGRARRFYEKFGYVERGRIPQFYGLDEAKVIFSRNIEDAAAGRG